MKEVGGGGGGRELSENRLEADWNEFFHVSDPPFQL